MYGFAAGLNPSCLLFFPGGAVMGATAVSREEELRIERLRKERSIILGR
jgi:hypothetical protein